ncbi:MAG: hypothetical protein ACI9TV_002123 [Sulfurimonas sp.]|jgi:hypothetical protein|uniref:hypothetical protein n=1 Tax=Sulfurimonas sp. TaxID=2022749 RepID=UPI0039E64BF1
MKILLALIITLSILKGAIAPVEWNHQIYAKITNLNQYSNIVIQQCSYGSTECSIIENDTFFSENGFHNRYFVMKREFYNQVDAIDETTFTKLYDRFTTIGKSFRIKYLYDSPYSDEVIDGHIEKEELYFEITQVNDENIVLEVKKRVLIYRDGRADEITNY